MLQPREFYQRRALGVLLWWGGSMKGNSFSPSPSEGGDVFPKYSFLSKRASLSCEKGVSSVMKESLLLHTNETLLFFCKQWVFTPLSIRRGGGVRLFLICKQWSSPPPFRRGVGGEAFSWNQRRALASVYSHVPFRELCVPFRLCAIYCIPYKMP